MRFLVCIFGCFVLNAILLAQPSQEIDTHALDTWLQHQQQVNTWMAEVQQVRKLKAIKSPLIKPGKIWFAGHQRFRWQLGDPVRTLAFRMENELLVLYPKLKRAERYVFTDTLTPAMQQAMLLMDVGFPAEPNTFNQQYELLASETLVQYQQFTLQPRDKQAQSLLSRLILKVRSSDWALLETKMFFPDGSTMTNTFMKHQFDVEFSPDLFQADLDGYTVEEPLKDR